MYRCKSETIDNSSSVFSSNWALLLKHIMELSKIDSANILQSCG